MLKRFFIIDCIYGNNVIFNCLYYIRNMKTKWIWFVLLLLLGACFKYEDGPLISLRSKTKRLTGVWKEVSVTYKGEESETVGSVKVEYKKDGTLEYRIMSDGRVINEPGTWEWLDKKNFILEKADSEDEYVGLEILRLANNELWVKIAITDDDAEVRKYKKIIEQ